MAVNRTDVSKRAYSGVSPPTDYFCGEVPGVKEWTDPNIKQLEYNPEEAERLLDEAGYPRGTDGVRFKTSIISWVTKGTPDAATVVISHLNDIGIEVTHIDIDWGTVTDRVINNKNFEMCFLAAGHGPDPSEIEKFFALVVRPLSSPLPAASLCGLEGPGRSRPAPQTTGRSAATPHARRRVSR